MGCSWWLGVKFEESLSEEARNGASQGLDFRWEGDEPLSVFR